MFSHVVAIPMKLPPFPNFPNFPNPPHLSSREPCLPPIRPLSSYTILTKRPTSHYPSSTCGRSAVARGALSLSLPPPLVFLPPGDTSCGPLHINQVIPTAQTPGPTTTPLQVPPRLGPPVRVSTIDMICPVHCRRRWGLGGLGVGGSRVTSAWAPRGMPGGECSGNSDDGFNGFLFSYKYPIHWFPTDALYGANLNSSSAQLSLQRNQNLLLL